MKTYPLLFSIDSGYIYPDDPNELRHPPEPESWLKQIIEQADFILSCWDEDARVANNDPDHDPDAEPDRRNHLDCMNARQNAQDALQAIFDGNVDAAMRSAFLAGRCIEKANRAGVIIDGLGKFRDSKNNSDNAADISAEVRAENASNLRDKVESYAKELLEEGFAQSDLCSTIERKLKLKDEISRTTTQIRNDLKALGIWIEKAKK
ncbi:MAG: hypothetical protein DRQ98_13855 [Gammaproteobacteria bacterium]|nr:MAG: hypothetical protein DRQ98_13855 [Gammaproteobacteria bacterium]